MPSNKAGSFLAHNSEQSSKRKKKPKPTALVPLPCSTEKLLLLKNLVSFSLTSRVSTLRVSDGTMLERKPEQKENQGLLLTYLTSGREKQKCLRVGVVPLWRTPRGDWQTASKNSIKWRRLTSYCSTETWCKEGCKSTCWILLLAVCFFAHLSKSHFVESAITAPRGSSTFQCTAIL